MHRWLAGLTFFFIAGHLVTLLFDTYAGLRVVDLLVPFSSLVAPDARSRSGSSPSICWERSR